MSLWLPTAHFFKARHLLGLDLIEWNPIKGVTVLLHSPVLSRSKGGILQACKRRQGLRSFSGFCPSQPFPLSLPNSQCRGIEPCSSQHHSNILPPGSQTHIQLPTRFLYLDADLKSPKWNNSLVLGVSFLGCDRNLTGFLKQVRD